MHWSLLRHFINNLMQINDKKTMSDSNDCIMFIWIVIYIPSQFIRKPISRICHIYTSNNILNNILIDLKTANAIYVNPSPLQFAKEVAAVLFKCKYDNNIDISF